MQSKNKLFILLAIIVLILAACNSSDDSFDNNEIKQEETTTITISGSGGVVTILKSIEADFEADNPAYDLDILAGSGTGGGVQGVSKGLLDIAAMQRPPKDTELEAAPSFVYVPLGEAGVAIMVHPSVTVDSLTSEQVTNILSGEITNWSEVGGLDKDIVLFVRDEEETSTGLLRDHVIGEITFSETTIILTSASDMISSIESTEYSIGYGTWSAVLAGGTDINAVDLDGIAPTEATYPMLTSVGIGYLQVKSDIVEVLVDWLVSATGQIALANVGIIIEE